MDDKKKRRKEEEEKLPLLMAQEEEDIMPTPDGQPLQQYDNIESGNNSDKRVDTMKKTIIMIMAISEQPILEPDNNNVNSN